MSVTSLTPSSSLACRSFEFMPVWDNQVKPGCQKILQNPFAPMDVTSMFTAVYRLASNPCTKVPVLIRGSQNERVETRDMTAQQCLVLYYLLRELLKDHLEKHILHPGGPLKTALNAPSCRAELAYVYVIEWYKMYEALRRLKSVFNYLQNHWHTLHMQNTNVFFNVISIGLNMWNEQVVGPNRVKLVEVMQSLYFDEMGPIPEEFVPPDTGSLTASQFLLRDLTSSFLDLDQFVSQSTYRALFEDPLVKELKRRYDAKADTFFPEGGPLLGSLLGVQKAVFDEKERIEKCTPNLSTVTEVKTIVLEHLLVKGDRLGKCLRIAMGDWLIGTAGNSPDCAALSLFFQLLKPSASGLKEFSRAFKEKIFDHGAHELRKAIVEAKGSLEFDFVKVIVDVCMHFDQVTKRAFPEDASMSEAFKEGIEKLVNKNGSWECFSEGISPLARYIHHLVVSGQVKLQAPEDDQANSSTGHSLYDLDDATQMVIFLFSLLKSRDDFYLQYHRDLSRRLIYFDKVDLAVERALVASINKFSLTPEHVHCFSKMIDERGGSFGGSGIEWRNSSGLTTALNHIRVIAFSHYWPFSNTKLSHLFRPKRTHGHIDSAYVPGLQEVLRGQRKVVDRWIPGISYATLQTNPKHFSRAGGGKPLDITLSHLQAIILLQFQSVRVHSVDYSSLITKITGGEGLSEEEAAQKSYPYSISDLATAVVFLGDHGLLKSNVPLSAAGLVEPGAKVTLSISTEYSPSRFMEGHQVNAVDLFTGEALFPQSEREAILDGVKGLMHGSPTGEGPIKTEVKESSQVLSNNARYSLIQAHIVRIVKAHTSIQHADLLKKIEESLGSRFEVRPEEVKAEIEKLLEKDYIERDTRSLGAYKFLA